MNPVSALKGGEDPHSKRRLMHALIAVQVAFCFLVLFVAGLFVTTFQTIVHEPTGFCAERLLVLDTVAKQPQPVEFWEQAAEHLRSVQGVETVALADAPLLGGSGWNNFISVNGAPPNGSAVLHARCFAGLAGSDEDSADRRKRLPAERYATRVSARQRNFCEDLFRRRRSGGKDVRSHDWTTACDCIMRSWGSWGMFGTRFARADLAAALRSVSLDRRERGAHARKALGFFWCALRCADPMALAPVLRQEVPQGAKPKFA